MNRFIHEFLSSVLALACAATVFVAAALDSPDAARAAAPPAPVTR